MAAPNYKFEKRQRDLAKAKKQEEKRQKKLARSGQADAPAAPESQRVPGAATDKH